MPSVIHTPASVDVPFADLNYECGNRLCKKHFHPDRRDRLTCCRACSHARASQIMQEKKAQGVEPVRSKRVHNAMQYRERKEFNEPRASGKPEDPCANLRDYKITEDEARRFMERYFA